MKNRLLLAVALVLVVVLGVELLVPLLAERLLRASISRSVGTDEVSVQLTATPGYHLLTGRVDHLYIVANHLQNANYSAEQLMIDVRDLHFAVWPLVGHRQWLVQGVGAGHAQLVMTDQDVVSVLQRHVKDIKNPAVHITEQGVRVSGSFSVGPVTLNASLDGQIVGSESVLKFAAQQVSLGHSAFGTAVRQEFALYDLHQLPVPMTVEGVTQQDGKIIVVAGTGGMAP